MVNETDVLRFEVPAELDGERLDRALAGWVDTVSRGRVTSWIKAGAVRVEARRGEKIKGAHRGLKPSLKLKTGQIVCCQPPPPPTATLTPQPIPFEVVYQDEELAVIEKPAGVVVHPGAGQPDQTLVNGLLHRFPTLSPVGLPYRPGIVHRLDRDTSGLLLVAFTERAHHHLSAQLAAREVARRYLALAWNPPEEDTGSIDTFYGRHPQNRIKFTGRCPGGKRACTHWRVLERLGPCGLMELRLETGRTHQIRVHMTERGSPLLADQLYGVRRLIERPPELRQLGSELGLRRHALHAAHLGFLHPLSGDWLSFDSPLPEEIEGALSALRATYLTPLEEQLKEAQERGLW